MSTVTLIGSGQMASALTFPLYENDHEVRLVGSPLDNEIIDRLREDNYHFNLLRTLHDGIHYYKV
ncbi:glycerol-3-phosphate dehydrogenase, partial [Eubacterium callanderi]|nr:glycerol-3-phosphate dehydrogenase [Eubacterium callanderi]